MKKNIMIICLFGLGMLSVAQAEEKAFKTVDAIHVFCNNAMQLVAEKKITKAFALVKQYWPFNEDEITSIEVQTIKQMNVIEARFGKPLGYELLKEKKVKDLFLRYVYVIKYEKHILKWVFTFYKPQKEWILNGFYWDDKVSDIF